MSFKFKKAILGGTFDHFHFGHESLIEQAFKQAEKVTIGVATSKLIQNKFLSQAIESYQEREDSVKEYLKKKNLSSRSEIISIADIYGSSLTDLEIEAIFVTEATLPNAQKINFKRKRMELKPLQIIAIPFVRGDDRRIITSERIRAGEADRSGNAFINLFKKTLVLPENLREELRKPIGKVLKNLANIQSFDKAPIVMSIGDITSILMAKANLRQEISVIDYKSRRELINQTQRSELKLFQTIKVANKPGTISKAAVKVLQLVFKEFFENKKKQTIVVDGEEDLLALPAILLSPLGSVIVYGIHNLGSVVVEVTEEKKKETEEIIRKFKS